MFETLSEIQKEIVYNKSGKFVVRACPGSGKTYSVAARLAYTLKSWKQKNQGIAAISFTNVACSEIEKRVNEFLGLKYSLGYPHFIGTIDSFINKYIFLPHGHLVMQCKNRPIIVGEPHGIWTGRFFSDSFFDNLSFKLDGEIYAVNPAKMKIKNWTSNSAIKTSKRRLVKAGYANQSDANYFAMKILEKFPCIAKALALKFPMLIIDEAQDTSDIQMKILDLLILQGLDEVMLVGDPDQAIFEWNEARPDLLVRKYNDWNQSITLNENRRSSRNICEFTYNLSSLPNCSLALNDQLKDYYHQPKIITYDNLADLIDVFIEECKTNNIPISENNVCVLYRSKSIVHEITGIAEMPFNISPWTPFNSYSKDFAKGKYLFDNHEIKQGFQLIERGVLKMFNSLSHCSDENIGNIVDTLGYNKFKKIVYQFLLLLPSTNNITIGEWISKTNENLKARDVKYSLEVEKKGRDFLFKQLFITDSELNLGKGYKLGTVHSVKGETYMATLLILKDRAGNKGKYSTLLGKTDTLSNEELRIAYVGITRPQKVLMLGVPDETNKNMWERKLRREKGCNSLLP
jgi:DNA helicase II / ATP-dependent DNA helicase PcrA